MPRIWREGNLTARSYSAKDDYAIQSPFTRELHYPAGHGAWRHPKKNILKWLSEWGTEYEERDIGDGKIQALMAKGVRLKLSPKMYHKRRLRDWKRTIGRLSGSVWKGRGDKSKNLS